MTGEDGPVRIAMWSGPRNISTALMRSFGARTDTVVVDEPFYAYFLAETGLDHPGRDRVLASQSTDWREVAAALAGPLPDGIKIHYQKHMAHHLLPGIDRSWLGALTNAYLIRDPDEVVGSYARVREEPTLDDLGFRQQVELYREHGGPVVDARDVLDDPAGTLAALCAALGIPFDEHMLRWEPGPRPTDGVWAPYWYASVERSTGFAPYRAPTGPLPGHLRPLADAARPLYEELHAVRLSQ
jgi:hypothetical protein